MRVGIEDGAVCFGRRTKLIVLNDEEKKDDDDDGDDDDNVRCSL